MLKTSFTPRQEQYLLRLPSNFVGKRVEIIAFTEEDLEISEKEKSMALVFNALKYSTKEFRFNRDEANPR